MLKQNESVKFRNPQTGSKLILVVVAFVFFIVTINCGPADLSGTNSRRTENSGAVRATILPDQSQSKNANAARRGKPAQPRPSVSDAPDAVMDSVSDEDVLIDFRSELAYDTPPLSADEEQRVLRTLGEAGMKMNVEDNINSVVKGSFTRSDTVETAYLIQAGGPDSIGPSALQGTTLAVFDETRLVARFDVSNYNFILRASDVNRDRVDELLLSGSNFQMGQSTSWAKLVEVKNGKLRVVKDFKILLRDSCDNQFTKTREVLAGVVRYAPPKPKSQTTFDVNFFRALCSSVRDGKRDPTAFELTPAGMKAPLSRRAKPQLKRYG